jgi:hypothetical protein
MNMRFWDKALLVLNILTTLAIVLVALVLVIILTTKGYDHYLITHGCVNNAPQGPSRPV